MKKSSTVLIIQAWVKLLTANRGKYKEELVSTEI